jgi:hypothetical protein
MTNLSLITKTEIKETGSASDEYKGFTVFASLARGCHSFSIGLLLEEATDACHWICSEQSAITISELKSEAKSIINDFEFTAKQLLDLDSVIELSNHRNDCADEPKSVEEIINDELERQQQERADQEQQKHVEVRQMNKDVYSVLMRSYRYARALILTAMHIDPDNHRQLAKRLQHINNQFEIRYIKPFGMDVYHPDSCHAWVINRAMDKMNLSACQAMELSRKLNLDPKTQTDYIAISRKVFNKNHGFYMHILGMCA